MFDKFETTNNLVAWIREYFKQNASPTTKAVIGISGGKDSSVVAALCVEALGKDRVFGVLMPQHVQSDIHMAQKVCAFLGIENITVNIGDTVDSLYKEIEDKMELTNVTLFNTPARIRMSMLYAISGTIGGRVANTCNLSEDYVGYATKFGDAAGDFSPLSHLLVSEVIEIGKGLGLPDEIVEKVPTDGLCGLTDEDNLGFTYDALEKYILGQTDGIDPVLCDKIAKMYKAGLHKMEPMPAFTDVVR